MIIACHRTLAFGAEGADGMKMRWSGGIGSG